MKGNQGGYMKKWAKGASIYLVILVVAFIALSFSSIFSSNEEIGYDDFVRKLEADQIESVKMVGPKISGEFKDKKTFKVYLPTITMYQVGETIDEKARQGKIEAKAFPESNVSIVTYIPLIFMGLLFMGIIWFLFMNNSQGGGSKVMSFGKSRAKIAKVANNNITFKDVAGLKEEKEEMEELVDFLKNPKRYTDLGARIPKGVLLVGPPGTGKTYLSRACAGEAGVPFYSISGSDFVEMFVGVGASRVRDLFEESKKNAPCIVFIDEIDAVGRKRGAGLGGGHDEREQTLNQLLVEMDGFSDNQGVIIMAATNRADILDPALLRPGRFDRQIMVGLPDIRGRQAIVKVHSRKKPIDDDVDFNKIAQATPGFTPADLENMMNEAAILTARRHERTIKMETIKAAIIKVIAGLEKKSAFVTDKEKKLVSYHEAGHAVLAKVLPDSDPIHQVTIIPRGHAGGFTMQLPEEDRNYTTKKHFETELIILLGGRVAEKIILGDISTGASNDLTRVTQIAKAMITKYAMSDNLGAMSYDSEEEVFIGRDFGATKQYSDQVAAEIDQEVRHLVDAAYSKAINLLEENIDKLHIIGKALIKYETLSGEEFDLAFYQGNDALDEFILQNKQRLEAERQKVQEERQAMLEKEQQEQGRQKMQQKKEQPADQTTKPSNPFSKE